jgi:7-cyano-7-deazaguanine synthase
MAPRSLLLLSGGIDSAAIAAWYGCDGALTIDYGQVPAKGEIRAAGAIAEALGIDHSTVKVDASAIGAGLLAARPVPLDGIAPEWWPFRNQLLVTIASTYAINHGFGLILVGSVAGDGLRHKDGSPEFYTLLDALVQMQEGQIRVLAPAAELSAGELLIKSGLSREILAWCHSCHRADVACGDCPGCWKRMELLGLLDTE